MALIKRRQNVVLFVIPSKVWQEWRVGGGGMPRISPKMNPIRGSSVTVSWTGQQIHQLGSRKPKVWNKSGLSGNRETGQKRGVNEPGRGQVFIKSARIGGWVRGTVTDIEKLFFCEVAQSDHWVGCGRQQWGGKFEERPNLGGNSMEASQKHLSGSVHPI